MDNLINTSVYNEASNRSARGNELNRFKRRLIKTIAKPLLEKKRSEKEIFCFLKKQMGCDCQLLWSRMRSLVIKKIHCMFVVNDCIDKIPRAARMSSTDWLMFDLVLVHQDINLIGDYECYVRKDPEPLVELFELVKKYEIESLWGDQLLRAWAQATADYNASRRKCSPMILQRRWYQFKEVTRSQFYKFWFTYRGSASRLSLAENVTPSPLQLTVARRYKDLVTSAFTKWEVLIEQKLVILANEFESYYSNKITVKAKVPDDAPDLELIEPYIETIDISDNDEKNEETDPEFELPAVRVKQEPVDTDIDIQEHPLTEEPKSIYDQVLESTNLNMNEIDFNIDSDKPEDATNLQSTSEQTEIIENSNNEQFNTDIENQNSNPNTCEENTQISDSNQVLPQILSVSGNVQINQDISAVSDKVNSGNDTNISIDKSAVFDSELINDIHADTDDSEKDFEEDIVNLDDIKSMNSNIINNISSDDDITELNSNASRVLEKPNEPLDVSIKLEQTKFSFGELPSDLSFADDGIAFIDDQDEEKNSDDTEEETLITDEKLLMLPTVYTTKIDDMNVLNTGEFDHVADRTLIDAIYKKSKPIKEKQASSTDQLILQHVEEEDSDSSINNDNQRVKESSYLFQKPRCRKYNPIQLCKNPDFNTRLKRLNIGFFGSPRNLSLLKSCKPMTIDLSKAFESKLVDGTLYLKRDFTKKTELPELNDTKNTENATVVPSAMPVQSLINNTNVCDFPLQEVEKPKSSDRPRYPNERNKVINLPDLSEIRRINQRLLTAEVAPIQVQNNRPLVPVSIISASNNINDYTYVLPTTTKKYKRSTNIKTPGVKQPRNFNKALPRFETIPWLHNVKNDTPKKNTEESLLTYDTLTKILYLLSTDKDDFEKEVSELDAQVRKTKKKITRQVARNSSIVDKSKIIRKKPLKPKINIKYAVNDPPDKIISKAPASTNVIDHSTNYPLEENKDEQTIGIEKSVLGPYCCWCRLRMVNLLFSTVKLPNHDCLLVCKCCCRSLLAQYLLNERQLKEGESPATETVENKDNRSEMYQKFLEMPLNMDNSYNSTPIVISSVKSLATGPVTFNESSTSGTKLTIEVTGSGSNTVCPVQTITADPIISLEDSPAISPRIASVETLNKSVEIASQSNKQELTLHNTETRSHISIKVLPSNNSNSVPVETQKFLSVAAITPMNVFTSSNVNKAPAILINQSVLSERSTLLNPVTNSAPKSIIYNNEPSLKITSGRKKIENQSLDTIKSKVNKILRINSRQINEKPEYNPIFLGKNKILLTTVKFPRYLNKFEEIKQNLTKLRSLPNGVQLVISPQGKVSCVRDPKVKINPLSLHKIPAMVAAIQKEISADIDANTSISDDVVDLVDDDDDDDDNSQREDEVSHPAIQTQSTGILSDTNKETTDNHLELEIGQTGITDESNKTVNIEDKVNSDIQLDNAQQVKESNQNRKDSINTSEISENQNKANSADSKDSTEDICKTESNNVLNVHAVNDSVITESEINICHNNIHKSPAVSDSVITESEINISHNNIQKPIESLVNDVPNSGENNVKISKEQTQTDNISETVATNTEIIPECTTVTKTKNILSDLMEMSGIFEEDIDTPIETQPSDIQSPFNVPHDTQEANQINAIPANIQTANSTNLPTIQKATNLEVSPTKLQSQTQSLTRDNPRHPIVSALIPELNPITSLYQLKYACSNNGLFFKLDLKTGHMVPINVCMKQQSASKVVPKTVMTKAVIDLTDDNDANDTHDTHDTHDINDSKNDDCSNSNIDTNEESTSHQFDITEQNISCAPDSAYNTETPTNSKSLLRVSNNIGTPKPLKLFKSIRPNILRKPNDTNIVLENETDHEVQTDIYPKKHKKLRPDDVSNEGIQYGEPLKKKKRKQKHIPIEIASNMTDNTNLTNVDNSSNQLIDPNKTLPSKTVTMDTDDSSDDEPLANLVKKKAIESATPANTMIIDSQDSAAEQNTSNNEMDTGCQYTLNFETDGEDEPCILGF